MLAPLHFLLDFLAPRTCVVCGKRLGTTEPYLCLSCQVELPLTQHLLHPEDNEMAKTFWGRIQGLERAVALMHYHQGSEAARLIYAIKYHHRPRLATMLGEWMGYELKRAECLNGVQAVIPVPLTPQRKRERGYNQSELLARGLQRTTQLPVVTDVVERVFFTESQTSHERWVRQANVEQAFRLQQKATLNYNHVLLLDDVVTTGATVCAVASLLSAFPHVRISVASLAFVSRHA